MALARATLSEYAALDSDQSVLEYLLGFLDENQVLKRNQMYLA